MKAGNRQTRRFHHALEAAEAVRYLAKRDAIHHQFSDTGSLFDYFHHAVSLLLRWILREKLLDVIRKLLRNLRRIAFIIAINTAPNEVAWLPSRQIND
jgi:hypothetical protein